MDLLIGKNFILFKKLNVKQISGKYSNINCNIFRIAMQQPWQDLSAKTIPCCTVNKEGEVGFFWQWYDCVAKMPLFL
jgi:hypothetical protein